MASEIDPDRTYSLAEARQLIPSARGGRVCMKTLHRWRIAGVLRCECRRVFRRGYYFVKGAEILRLLATEPPPTNKRTPAAHARAQRWAQRDLEKFYPQLVKG